MRYLSRKLASSSVRTLLFILVVVFLCLLAVSGTARQISERLQGGESPSSIPERRSERPNLFSTGYFPALHGYFFLDERNQLHVYRALPAVRNPQSQKLELRPEDDELKPKWNGEPYYHEWYVMDEGEWAPKMWGTTDTRGGREFSGLPERYLKFESCDRNDALDVGREDLKRPLGRQIKIKSVAQFGDYAVVLYSVSPAVLPGAPPPYEASERPAWLSLLEKTGRKWELLSDVRSVSRGNYCGEKILSTNRGGKSLPLLLLFFEEGDYNVAHSYVVD